MNVKRYFAQSAREALRALKAELGADAIVLSNRAVEGGVEILALPAEAVGAIEASASARAPAPARPAAPPSAAREAAPRPAMAMDSDDDGFRVSLSPRAPAAPQRTSRPAAAAGSFDPSRTATPDFVSRQRGYVDEQNLLEDSFGEGRLAAPPSSIDPRGARTPRADTHRPAPPRADLRRPDAPRAGTHAHNAVSASTDLRMGVPPRNAREVPPAEVGRAPEARLSREDDARIASLQQANTQLMGELGAIRGMIERQLAGFAWGETRRNAPARAAIVGELLEAGFSGQFARQLGDTVPDGVSLDEAREAVRQALARDLRAMSSDADLIDQGGVYALVGPTGVGKTTTTAKIAARCVVRHGAEKLALITTDGYRIGAQEQLRIYGRILGVPVFPVRDAADLRQTLAELGNKHMVLIDTVGMSQRDRMVAHQAAMLMGAGKVRRLLLLNATCRGDTLDDVIRAYQGPHLAGCIFSKVDEAASLAPVIGAAIAHQLEVCYVANGQRVPEDVHLPNRAYLLHRALRPKSSDSPWKMESDEAALMMAASGTER